MIATGPRSTHRGRTLLAGLMALAALGGLTTAGCGRAARPNVVLIVVDSLSADAVGGPTSVTPRIDRLAAEGLRFDRAIAQASWNLPSISSLVTSAYPSQHGQGVSAPGGGTATLAEALGQSGYRTAAFSEVEWALLQRGFASFTNTAAPHLYGDPAASNAQKTFGSAVDWIRVGGPGPFFAFIHTYEAHSYFMGKPHAQAQARREQPGYKGRFLDWRVRDTATPVGPRVIDALLGADAQDLAYVRGLYRGATAAVDTEVGCLMDALAQQGLDDSTIVIVTSSNGEGFRPDLKRVHHGGRLHDDQLHVPLVVRWPGHIVPGVVRSLVELTDVAPTILAAVGAPPNPQFRGQALLTADTGFWARVHGARFAPAPAKKMAFAEESAMQVDAQGRRQSSTARQTTLYSDWVQLIETASGTQLYDLKGDPSAEHDVAAAQPTAVAALKADLARQTGATAHAQGPSSETNDQLRSLGYVQ